MRLILYRRANCELCEMAEAALAGAGVEAYTRVDIGWDGALADRYGWTIPVLRDDESARELAWPFDAYAVRRFLTPRAG